MLTDPYRGKNVLVTGGLGTVGSSIARRLVYAGANISLLDCLVPESGGNKFNISGIEKDVRVITADLRDYKCIKDLISGQEYIFNLAGLGCHSDSMRNPLKDMEMNLAGHILLLEICRQFNPGVIIVYASTRQIYGKPDRLPVSEDHPLRPVDVNGINKLAAEQYHLLYHKVYDMQTSSIRMTNTIGPCMRIKDSRQIFYGMWFRLLLEGKPFEVWGGEQLRDINYTEDVVDAFLMLGADRRADGKAWNIGSGSPISLKDMADLMIRAYNQGEYVIKPFPDDRKRIDIGDYIADISAMEQKIGWKPKTLLEDAVKYTLDYYEENYTHYV